MDHPSVAEAAVIGRIAAEVKGQGNFGVRYLEGAAHSGERCPKNELKQHVVGKIGAIARPDDIFLQRSFPQDAAARSNHASFAARYRRGPHPRGYERPWPIHPF